MELRIILLIEGLIVNQFRDLFLGALYYLIISKRIKVVRG